MNKFIKSIPFHFKSATKSLVRHLVMTLSASSAVMVTLVLFAVFLILVGNVGRFTKNIESEIRIHAVVDVGIEKMEELQKIQQDLQAIPAVEKVELSTKDNEIKMWVLEKGEIFSSYASKEENPLTDAFFIHVKDPFQIESVNEAVLQVPGIRNSVYGGNSINDLVMMLDSVRHGIVVFVVLLVFLAVFLISNTIKTTIFARAHEIAIMRNVGATNRFIQMPFMIEGMFIGLFGAIVPCLLTYFGYDFIYNALDGKLFTNIFMLEPVQPFVMHIMLILILSGMIVGVLGSCISTAKYLRWKR